MITYLRFHFNCKLNEIMCDVDYTLNIICHLNFITDTNKYHR